LAIEPEDLVTDPLCQVQMPLRIYPRHFRAYLEDTNNLVMAGQGRPKKRPRSSFAVTPADSANRGPILAGPSQTIGIATV